jgi:polyisoprenoid-binding protein YceI
LLAHVKASDFLDVERHPEITFNSTSFDVSGEELVIRGDLTIKGRTQEVEARGTLTPAVSDPTGNVRVGLAAQATIDRTAIVAQLAAAACERRDGRLAA